MKYSKAVKSVNEAFSKMETLDGLYPDFFSRLSGDQFSKEYSLGESTLSFYETLLKGYIQSGYTNIVRIRSPLYHRVSKSDLITPWKVSTNGCCVLPTMAVSRISVPMMDPSSNPVWSSPHAPLPVSLFPSF